MSEQTLEFEREKWRGKYELRKREIEIKEREASRSRWSSPLVLAVLAAAIAALGNGAAIWLTGKAQLNLEIHDGSDWRRSVRIHRPFGIRCLSATFAPSLHLA
jgi:hypothetical protein